MTTPTYEDIGDHIEAVRVHYDPIQVPYAELLLLFWAGHDPTRAPFKRQYQPAVFPRTPDQAEQAHASKTARADEEQTTLTTDIIEDAPLYRAEPYHQKHKLRRVPVLLDVFQRWYPDAAASAEAPSAALVNGYVGGYRVPRHLEHDGPRLGLPDEADAALRRLVSTHHGRSQVP